MTLTVAELIKILTSYKPDGKVYIGTDEEFDENARPTIVAYEIGVDDIEGVVGHDDGVDFEIGDVIITARVEIGDEVEEDAEVEAFDAVTP